MVYKARWIDRLLPATCLLCGARAPRPLDACPGCIAELPRLGPACPRCAMPLPAGCRDALTCGQCLGAPPPFSACHCAFRYAFPVRELVLRFKGAGDLAAGRMLAELLARELAAGPAAGLRGWTLLPVPLAPARLAERGFNQAERIAAVLGGRLGLRVDRWLATRTRQAQDQKQLSAAARRANLVDAFRAGDCRGARLLVVDDVMTTGATAAALATALRAAGASEVRVCCLARAV